MVVVEAGCSVVVVVVVFEALRVHDGVVVLGGEAGEELVGDLDGFLARLAWNRRPYLVTPSHFVSK